VPLPPPRSRSPLASLYSSSRRIAVMPAWALTGLLGVAGSSVLVVVGLSGPGRRWHGVILVALGLLGIALSAGWLALSYYVDSVVE
jgi:hypothetical protein